MRETKIGSKTKIFIGILIIGIFLVGGLWIWNQINCKDICYGNKISPCKPTAFKCICSNMKFCSKKCGAECETDADCPSGEICDKESCKCIQKQEVKEILEQEALKIDISKPQRVSPNTYKKIIEIYVTNYSISKVDGFDLIKIEGSEEIHADGRPIIPKIGYIYMPLPKSAGNIKLSMVKNVSTTIGYYNIPCFIGGFRVYEPTKLVNCTAKPWPNFTEIYPIPPYWFHISEFDDYKKVAIGSALVQYNPQTKETILYKYIKLEFVYETPITLVITDFSSSKTEYALGEPINASLTVENVGSDTLTGLRAKLVIKDQYGKIRASSLSAPFDIASGESKIVYVTLNQDLPSGSYLLEAKVMDSAGNILGDSSGDVGIH